MDTPYVAIRLPSASSTQIEARARFEGAPILVVADRQTHGRGRAGAAWVTADRALACSLAWEPDWDPASWPRIPLTAALAARDVLGDRVGLSWPNDLVVAGAKVGGILVESDGAVVTAGLGVNLWWPDPLPGAAALHASDPGGEAAGRLAAGWASSLLARVASAPDEWGHGEYVAASVTVGHEVTWEPDGEGRAVGIGHDGSLLVETAAGHTALNAGEVRRVRPR